MIQEANGNMRVTLKYPGKSVEVFIQAIPRVGEIVVFDGTDYKVTKVIHHLGTLQTIIHLIPIDA